jgi:fructose-1-phosphate kinase PfkB-like protein
MKSHFNRLSPGTKEQMKTVIDSWKRSGKPSVVLAEGLAMLAEDGRECAANMIKRNGTPAASVAATYGKGTRAKLALEKDDARLLLEVVSEIREIEKDEEKLRHMIDMAAAILLNGEHPPNVFNDRAYEKLMEVLSQFHPLVVQRSLF